jgi:hypothetical protein
VFTPSLISTGTRRNPAGAAILLPLADDDGRLDGLLRGQTAFWRRRGARRAALGGAVLAGSAPARAPPAAPPAPPPYPGRCPAEARPLLDAIDAAFRSSPICTAQRGQVDWGLVEAGEASACNNAASGCAVNNPSAPYGLVVLPLAPEEVSSSGSWLR